MMTGELDKWLGRRAEGTAKRKRASWRYVTVIFHASVNDRTNCQRVITMTCGQWPNDGRILAYHRRVCEQSATERSVLRQQKTAGTVFRQKWRHQGHCRHLNINLKLTFFHYRFPSRKISNFPHIDVQWLQCYCSFSLKWLTMMMTWHGSPASPPVDVTSGADGVPLDPTLRKK